ncbi:hypothetical protein JDN40_03975 [Rhodomicrobium vannielii ATCC 17100]|uniref:hypothetical protein n=1 Tax=Rhodomicrobium vannielii TaxID=1069 RepID=UPI001918AA3E|nr:hypothetical protein [Rhodomicrobium vannielii]MBJ7533264.1 hypothetical protein [Rhodomicrobium vannielii ATCC 17100]
MNMIFSSPKPAISFLALAGGKAAVLEAVKAEKVPRAVAPYRALDIVAQRAEGALVVELLREARAQCEILRLLAGERPSDATDAARWDEELKALLLPALQAHAARAGVAAERVAGVLARGVSDAPDDLWTVCGAVVGLMLAPLRDASRSAEERLAVLGIGATELVAAEKPADAKRRETLRVGRRRAVDYMLPASVFQALRKIGVSDKAACSKIGVPRSTLNRASNGTAADLGLTADEARNMAAFVLDLRNCLNRVVAEMTVYGVEVRV